MVSCVVVLKSDDMRGYVSRVKRVFEVVDVVVYGEESSKDADLFVAIGGDGTFLWACHIAENKPVIGFKRGRIGFLATFDIELIEDILIGVKKGALKPVERTRLNLDGIYALNDITINAQEARMIEVSFRIEGHREISFRGDGIIIATPTGSTAYNLAAGGPIVLPDIPAYIITPISPHTLSLRPMVISSENRIFLRVNYRHAKALLSADGRPIRTLKNGEEIVVSKGKPALIFTAEDFFESLFQNLVGY